MSAAAPGGRTPRAGPRQAKVRNQSGPVASGDRGARAHAALRRPARARRRLADRRTGRDPRAAGPERRRQDDAARDPRGADDADARRGRGARRRRLARARAPCERRSASSPRATARSTCASPGSRTSSSSPACTACDARGRARAPRSCSSTSASPTRPGARSATYSHGMQKRLSVARALLTAPPVLLVDEATHDLDPEAAPSVRELVAGLAARRRRRRLGDAANRRDPRVRRPRSRCSATAQVRVPGDRARADRDHATPRSFVLRLRQRPTSATPAGGVSRHRSAHGTIARARRRRAPTTISCRSARRRCSATRSRALARRPASSVARPATRSARRSRRRS